METTAPHPAGYLPPAVLVGPEVRAPSDGAEAWRARLRRIESAEPSHEPIRAHGRRHHGAPGRPVPREGAAPGSGTSLLPPPLKGTDRGGGVWPHSLYLAQQIAQEVLEEGLYIDPHPAASAAYRAAARGPSPHVDGEGALDLSA